MQENISRQKTNIIIRKSKNLAMAFIILSDIAKIDLNLSQSIKTDAIDFFKDMSISKGATYLNENILSSIMRNINLFDSYAKLAFQLQKISIVNYQIIHEHVKSIEQDIEVYKNNFNNQYTNFSDDQIKLSKLLKDNLDNDSHKKDNQPLSQRFSKKDTMPNISIVKDNSSYKNPKSIEIISRQDNIINILKNSDNLSISDISKSFPNIAVKTLQRDLNFLLLDGKVKVYGTRRWARYSVK